VTLADERARQLGTRTSTYTGAPVLDPTDERGWETERCRMAQAVAPSSTLPFLPFADVRQMPAIEGSPDIQRIAPKHIAVRGVRAVVVAQLWRDGNGRDKNKCCEHPTAPSEDAMLPRHGL